MCPKSFCTPALRTSINYVRCSGGGGDCTESHPISREEGDGSLQLSRKIFPSKNNVKL